ncbi:MAG: universal stress protein UspE [Vibrionaceae bacterium]
MSQYVNLLVAVSSGESQPALERAIELAKCSASPVTITLFHSVYDFSYEITSLLSSQELNSMKESVIQQQTEWVQGIADRYRSADLALRLHVEWHKRPYEAIVAKVLADQHDLLIKAPQKSAALDSIIFTPEDWHLLRKCPCPVLLVKEQGLAAGGKILVAVSPASEDDEHQALNDKLISHAQLLAKSINSEVYLINAYPSTPINITIELPEFDPIAHTDAVRGHHLLEMKKLRQKHHIDEAYTFCEEGLPEDVISNIAKELPAALVILGTAGRVGLSALFIGNTAERTLDQLNCDILAIKPDGYVSPQASVNK